MTLQQGDLVEHITRYRAHFPGPHLEMVLDSMLGGNTAGTMWTTQATTSPLFILWDKGNDVFYLAGDDGANASIDALARVLAEQVLPQAIAGGVHRFKVRAVSSCLEEHVPAVFPGIALKPTVNHFSVYPAARPVHVSSPSLDGVRFLPITPTLLNDDGLADIEYVRDEIRGMWPSDERFYQRGFGSLAALENAMICWCTAEYVGPERCGIGIATASPYEGQGVATATAGHFVQQALARGLTPCWECDASNIASVRVAEKAGFVLQAEETYWVGLLLETIE